MDDICYQRIELQRAVFSGAPECVLSNLKAYLETIDISDAAEVYDRVVMRVKQLRETNLLRYITLIVLPIGSRESFMVQRSSLMQGLKMRMEQFGTICFHLLDVLFSDFIGTIEKVFGGRELPAALQSIYARATRAVKGIAAPGATPRAPNPV